ncbi:MAG: acyl-CoA thioesterase [Alkalibacterium sp.]|uniref:Acyl-CoA hydrolase n=1 Tax=Alkalibacterium gilvum TaxID=1130080 RepID=A0A1H6UCS4_9LACT|nr:MULTISPECIES: acyl-CoA thioesterase [Alkalibacterium]MDN6193878.1 acyl-CoA thioesterase [Alkalibacterium sp.]MDN6294223.1 acyl-CoA thioesterase [Alkalibacterium sp.]MDN6295967.1 acyl-CoA thioesterase [Alkalibacterium sp.]MDN6326613.1 acyl-CoA thioesterase [Alkalibacterium sp.]MDN6385719.1 acyl-CoA thioesterase [Alkalibacterium sp.]
MTNKKSKALTCNATRVVQTHRILPPDLNDHQTLFGGKLMSLIDDTASISVSRFARTNDVITASMDELHFIHPIEQGHSVCVESYVSGAGRTSVEVFVKVLGENLLTGERYIAATSFITFVVPGMHPEQSLPDIAPENNEEKMICGEYKSRRKRRLTDRKANEKLVEAITLLPPWFKNEG